MTDTLFLAPLIPLVVVLFGIIYVLNSGGFFAPLVCWYKGHIPVADREDIYVDCDCCGESKYLESRKLDTFSCSRCDTGLRI